MRRATRDDWAEGISVSIKRFACAVLATLAVSLVAATTVAQESSSDERDEARAQAFRKGIVERWGWRPNYGVALTTTQYARKYLAERPESYGDYFFRANVGPSRVVLFQTDELDIWASGRTGVFYSVIERDSGKVLADNGLEFNPSPGDLDARFVDVDSAPPFEFYVEGYTNGGTGLAGSLLRIYDLKNGFDPMLEASGQFDAHNCPELQPRLGGHTPKGASIGASITIDHSYVLALKAKSGWSMFCQMIQDKTTWKRHCSFNSAERAFQCREELIESATLNLQTLKLGGWQENAKNIRWVIENADMLEKKGFRFPEGFLERLPRHLPGHESK
jgi:hypothetical protein